MDKNLRVEIEFPTELGELEFPGALERRLHTLLDKQSGELGLTREEREEAEGLVKVSEWLSLLRLRAERIAGEASVAS